MADGARAPRPSPGRRRAGRRRRAEATARIGAVAPESLGSTSPAADARLLTATVDGLRLDALTGDTDDVVFSSSLERLVAVMTGHAY